MFLTSKTESPFSANDIRTSFRCQSDRFAMVLRQVEHFHAMVDLARKRQDYDAVDILNSKVRLANDIFAEISADGYQPPLHTCEPHPLVDNTAEHDRLERERSLAHSAQVTSKLTDTEATAQHSREKAAENELQNLRIVRQIRTHSWTVTIWIVKPGAPFAYDATAVFDGKGPAEPLARFMMRDAARFAAELCEYIR